MKKKLFILLLIIFAILCLALTGCTHAYKLSFSQDEYTIISGIEFEPSIIIRPKNQEYELLSSNVTIAKVVNNKLISIKEGKTEITVRSGDMTANAILFVDNDIEYDGSNVKFAETVTVNFVITNYELANLENENFSTPITILKGEYANFKNDPYLSGYDIDFWYTDRDCTQKFNANANPLNDNITLYAMLTQCDLAYSINNHIVSGLVYKNLGHSILTLPEIDKNGEEVIGIASKAFEGDSTITEVNIPCTYVAIGDYAFAGCKNLKTVNYTGGESQLEVIGVNAFGITFDEYNNEKDSCESLSKMTLPDSIYEIGGYAFYKCINLSLNDIPSGLTVIKNYAFAYTKINNIDFTNVSEIGEYAFSHCSYLSIVSNTTKVTKCKKLAFEGTKLWQNQRTECLQNCDQDVKKAVFYAGTIVIGTHENYGNMFGDGTLQLSESATIIADEAFKGTKLTELYIYLTSNISREVIEGNKYEFIGDDVFYDTLGAHIIVPQDLETTYKAKYPVLSPHIGYVITETISVGVNKGTHTVWISHNASNKVAHYINYEGTGISIDLGSLANNLTFSYWERISLGAFSSNDTVTNINLGKVNYIASFAINASMTKLVTIYLTNCTSPPIMESDFSIQFEDSSSKIYVKQEDLSAYRRKWSDHATMLTYLNGVD